MKNKKIKKKNKKRFFVENEFPEVFTINKFFSLTFCLLYKTNRIHVALRLFSNRSQF